MAASICIAISGPSSSGKTTVSRLLRSAFTSTTTSSTKEDRPPITCTILHGDDFYIPDSQLPIVELGTTGQQVQDWDCPEALDFSRFLTSVRYAKLNGRLPEEHVTYETTHAVGVEESIEKVLHGEGVKDVIDRLEGRVRDWIAEVEEGLGGGRRIENVVIVDGFLLFGKGVPEELRAEFDVKFMIRTPYEKAKRRREERSGYTTMEGFWHDPEGYFELLVWPAYLKEHSYLFKDGDMDAGLLTQEALDAGIRTPLQTDQTLMETLKWAIDALVDSRLGEKVVASKEEK